MNNAKKGKFFIISGISGAGKTQVLKILGDFGFYCVDNLPVALFKDFVQHVKTRENMQNIAVCIDIREGERIKTLPKVIEGIEEEGFDAKLIFVDAADAILIRRFSETKHRHPLADQLGPAIAKEREWLQPIKDISDGTINTSNLTLGELKERISKLLEITRSQEMIITVVSFGFKNGSVMDADLVMDVRFLRNPYYQPELRDKTGLDPEVQDFIKKTAGAKGFLKKFTDFILYLIPKYIKEGKSYLTIGIGCTGGKHRSVFMAHSLAESLRNKGFKVSEYHRDLKIEKKEVW